MHNRRSTSISTTFYLNTPPDTPRASQSEPLQPTLSPSQKPADYNYSPDTPRPSQSEQDPQNTPLLSSPSSPPPSSPSSPSFTTKAKAKSSTRSKNTKSNTKNTTKTTKSRKTQQDTKTSAGRLGKIAWYIHNAIILYSPVGTRGHLHVRH